MTNILYKSLDGLRADAHPWQIAAGAMLGLLLGFNPWATLQGILLLSLVAILRVNLGTLLLSFLLSRVLAALCEGLFDSIGHWWLAKEGLRYLWTSLYHAPLVPYTRFNHTIVLGAWMASSLMIVPVGAGAYYAAHRHGARLSQAIWDSSLLRLYEEYRQRQT